MSIRFVDPAFTCELVLQDEQLELYNKGRAQFERLKTIADLGIAADIADAVVHTKHHHLVGLMRLFDKLLHQPRRQGVPKKFIWSFWCRLCFAQTGHSVFSYDAEKAVLLACQVYEPLRLSLVSLLTPVLDKLVPCDVCTFSKSEQCQAIDNLEKASLLENMVDEDQWDRLHLWIAALKLIQSVDVNTELHAIQAKAQPPDPNVYGTEQLSYSEPEAYKMLTTSSCYWNDVINRTNQLDYVCRDLAYTGKVNVRFDYDSLLADVKEASNEEWKLISELDSYLRSTRYLKPEHETKSVIFQRELARLLVAGYVTIGQLFGLGEDVSFGDKDLASRMKNRSGLGRMIFEENGFYGWSTWHFSTTPKKNLNKYSTEVQYSDNKKTFLTSTSQRKYICYKSDGLEGLNFAIKYQNATDCPRVAGILKTLRRIIAVEHPFLDSSEIEDACLSIIVDENATNSLRSFPAILAAYSSDSLPELKSVSSIMTGKYREEEEGLPIYLKLGDSALRLTKSAMDISLAGLILSDPETAEKEIANSTIVASSFVWEELLNWHTLFPASKYKSVEKLILSVQQELLRLIAAGIERPKHLEYFTLLEALKYPPAGVSFRITLPNLIVLRDDGQPLNEYDTVSLVLKSNKEAQLWIWETTDVQNIRKMKKDISKMHDFRTKIEARWGDQMEIVVCHVSRTASGLIVNIGGDKRLIPFEE